MNSRDEILTRLLRHFPVKNLIEHFDTNERTQELAIVEICQDKNDDEIFQFVSEYFPFTKQNVSVYSIRNKYVRRRDITEDELQSKILYQDYSNNRLTIIGYNEFSNSVTYVDGQNVDNQIVEIKQPFKLVIEGNYLIISVTKMESNPKTYFDHEVAIINSTGGKSDSEIIHNILNLFDSEFRVRPLQADLNKGVKELWNTDVIDAKELSFRKTSSRAKEVMDEDTLFKERYPQEYDEVMKAPLELCIFRYVMEDEDWPKHFTCDPRVGKISFTLYSENSSQVNNVIDGIIGNN